MKTILVPLDGSALAERVLPYVQLLAPLLSADVRLLHVVSEIDRYYLLAEDPRAVDESDTDSWGILRKNAATYLLDQADILHTAGIDTEFEVQRGEAPELIVERAQRIDATLIAMATHGYSGLRRWALGSVADKVLHATSTPLILVRAQP